ncbi:MAG: T9SS type A sorting domain-containing protein [Bacteroidota bacterium]|jgi:hypothetical protein
MKTVKLLFGLGFTLLFHGLTNAQGLQGDFENWDSVEVSSEGGWKNFLPTGWFEFGNIISASENKPLAVERTTDAYAGEYAIKLTNVATSLQSPATMMTNSGDGSTVNNKIPVAAKYTRLEGYYKYNYTAKDTFTITVMMVKGEDIIGVGEFTKSDVQNDYIKFNVPIMYMPGFSGIPDSAVVIVTAGSTETFKEGSTLTLDELNFSTSSTGILEHTRASLFTINAWPNPTKEILHVDLNQLKDVQCAIEVVDITGKVILEHQTKPNNQSSQVELNVTNFKSGVYFVRVTTRSGSHALRFVKE